MGNVRGHSRRSIRLKGYDYTKTGAYFVTIKVHGGLCRFGDVVGGQTVLNVSGRMAQECWHALPKRFPRLELDEFIVMPNHVHGILRLGDRVRDDSQHKTLDSRSRVQKGILRADGYIHVVPGSLGAIIRSYKSAVTKAVNTHFRSRGGGLWQANYHDHVIRNAIELERIRKYIRENPKRWEEARERMCRRNPRRPT